LTPKRGCLIVSRVRRTKRNEAQKTMAQEKKKARDYDALLRGCILAQNCRVNDAGNVEFLCAYCGNELNKPFTMVSRTGKVSQTFNLPRQYAMELCHIETRCETLNNSADNLFYGHAVCNRHQNEVSLELHLDNINAFLSFDAIVEKSKTAYAHYAETKTGTIYPRAFLGALYVNEHSAARITATNLERYAAHAA
jgi:hypothetical protein